MVYLFLALVFSLFVAVFAVQNALPVTVALLYWSCQTSLVIVILGSATFGALAIFPLALFMQLKSRWALQKARQRQDELEVQIKTLQESLDMERARDITENDL